jgi:hypothetical protein
VTYNQQQNGDTSGTSVATVQKQLDGKNNSLLQSNKNALMMDVTADKVKEMMVNQVNSFNQWISDHVGWPESKYKKNDYGLSQSYMDALVKGMKDQGALPKNQYEGSISMDDQLSQVRYAIFNQQQLHVSKGNAGYHEVLKNWLQMGHPALSNSLAMVLLTTDCKSFDGMSSNLQADINVNGENYRVYMISFVGNGENDLRVLDVKMLQ